MNACRTYGAAVVAGNPGLYRKYYCQRTPPGFVLWILESDKASPSPSSSPSPSARPSAQPTLEPPYDPEPEGDSWVKLDRKPFGSFEECDAVGKQMVEEGNGKYLGHKCQKTPYGWVLWLLESGEANIPPALQPFVAPPNNASSQGPTLAPTTLPIDRQNPQTNPVPFPAPAPNPNPLPIIAQGQTPSNNGQGSSGTA